MRAPALLLFAVVTSLAASLACSNQGEGEFCSQSNGDNDCQGGLSCVPAQGLSTALTNRDRCCPIPPAQPTTAACSISTTTVIDAATEVPDAIATPAPDAEAGSPTEASVADATGDVVSADAPGDAVIPSPDASHEAGADASPE
jgi:hypothetical protein